MKVRQISIFLENKSGRLEEVCKVLGEAGINIRALSIADTTDFGILRLIVDDPDRAIGKLEDAGFAVSMTDVIAVEVSDQPGGLAATLGKLKAKGIDIEYIYAFVQKASNAALVVLRVEKLDEAIELLQNNGSRLLSEGEVCRL